MTEKFIVGRDCDAWCTRCKLDLAHIIVAMVDALPVQVKCNTCGGVHKYRAPKSAPKAASSRRTTASSSSRSTASKRLTKAQIAEQESARELRLRWDQHLARLADVDARRYSVKEAFASDEVIEHPKFGVGFVLEEVTDKRIKVLFQDAERVLVCRHGS